MTEEGHLCLRIYKKDILNPKLFEKVGDIFEGFSRLSKSSDSVFIESELRKDDRTKLINRCDIYAFDIPIGVRIRFSTNGYEYKITKLIDNDELLCIPISFIIFMDLSIER